MAQSVESGERTFNQQCKACHTVDKGGRQHDRPQPASA